MVDVRGDVLRPPHGTTPAAVKSNKHQKWDPLRAMKSKKISNDQELIQSDPISCPQNQKGNNYINWRQFTKGTRGKPNEQLFPK